jgi:hypothetical protein
MIQSLRSELSVNKEAAELKINANIALISELKETARVVLSF